MVRPLPTKPATLVLLLGPATPTASPLPTNPVTLALLLRVATDTLAYLEPIRQQLDREWWVIRQFSQKNFNGREFFDQVHRALRGRIAEGGPDYGVLLDYLDFCPAPDLSADLPEPVALLDRVPSPPGVDRDQWKTRMVAGLRKFARVRQEAHDCVRALQRLQRKLIEHMEGRDESAPTGVAVEPDNGVEPDGQGRGQAGPRKPAGGKTKGEAGPAARPSAACDQWALGFGKDRHWQIFRKFGGGWRHHGTLRMRPVKGRESTFLEAFAEADGSLTRVDLINKVLRHFTDEDGKRIYPHIVKPTVSRLRARLRKELNLGKKTDPVPWDDALKGYRMLIAVGYADKDDEHRWQFCTRKDLIGGAENWATS
jgi:hypothetical protein